MSFDSNPFPASDADRYEIWDMLVRRDILAYLDLDWPTHARDYASDLFVGIDATRSSDPDGWRPGFSSLAIYRDLWLDGARAFAVLGDVEQRRMALFRATTLRHIDVADDLALAHKKLLGGLPATSGTQAIRFDWQTVYVCRRVAGQWKIAGFVGNLPLHAPTSGSRKIVPPSSQHVTAGPYSPVIEVAADRLVVISGQAAILPDGKIAGATISEQVRLTLENCRQQLTAADTGLDQVFKVNVYLADIGDWATVNLVYREIMPAPFPARTAIQAVLLPGLFVEIDMWATKP